MKFLPLPGWKVLGLKETPIGISMRVELTTEPGQCQHCSAFPESLRLNGIRLRTVKDIPVKGLPVKISLMQRRYLCTACKRTSLQPLLGVDGYYGATARLIKLAAQRAFCKPFWLIAEETDLSENVVRNAFSKEVRHLEHIESSEAPRVLGINIVCVGKRERLLLTDIEERRVINLTANTDQKASEGAILKLRNHWRIEVVTLAILPSLRLSVRRMLPQAKIIVDRFLIMSLSKDAVDKVREQLSRELDQLSDCCNSEMAAAYVLKARFMDVWRSSSSLIARHRYSEWAASVPEALIYAFGPLMQIVETWHKEIFGYFDYYFPDTNSDVVGRQIKTSRRGGRHHDIRQAARRLSPAPPLDK
jgi:transposase